MLMYTHTHSQTYIKRGVGPDRLNGGGARASSDDRFWGINPNVSLALERAWRWFKGQQLWPAWLACDQRRLALTLSLAAWASNRRERARVLMKQCVYHPIKTPAFHLSAAADATTAAATDAAAADVAATAYNML